MSVSPPPPPLRELTSRQVQWIGAGYAMSVASMAGQTIFIAQFNAALRGEFSLSNGQFGVLYTLATLGSSIALVWGGALADRISPRRLALTCLGVLAAIALGMSRVNDVILLGIALFGLRFFGQGMMVQIAMTTMARWFNRFRGRALSFAQLGFPSGEAVMPLGVTLAIAAFGWRQVWLMAAAMIVAVMMPVIAFLLRDPPDGKRARARGEVNPDGDLSRAPTGVRWTRGAVLRDALFYLTLPGTMGPPAIGTLFIFHQAHLAAMRGWDLTVFTAFFPVLSVSSVITAILAGMLVDRFGAWRIVAVLLVPEGIGCLAVGLVPQMWAIPVLMAMLGATGGMIAPVTGALWAELYGSAHIGTIRALATSGLVLASAVGPGIAGVLIDAGFDLDRQAFIYAAYCLVCTAGYLALRPAFAARIGALSAEGAAAAA